MKSAALFLLSLFVFVSPFPHTQTLGEVCFYSALLIFGYFYLHHEVIFQKYDIWTALLLFGSWSLVSSLFALDPSGSFADLYSHFIKYLILTAMLVHFFGSRQRLITLGWVIVISGATFAFVITCYFYGILAHKFLIPMGLPRWPTNTMGFVFLFSLAVIFPLFRHNTSKKIQYFLIVAAIVLIIAALLTQSRGTFIALMVMSVVFCYRYQRMLFVSLLLILVSVVIVPNLRGRFAKGDPPRIALSLYTVEIIKDYPLTGIGFARDTFRDPTHIDSKQYADRIPQKYRDVVEFNFPHNMILDVAVRTGLIGVTIFCAFWGVVFLTAYRLLRQAQDPFIGDWALALLAALSMFAIKGMFEPTVTHFVLTVFHSMLSMLMILAKLQTGSSAINLRGDKQFSANG